MAGRPKTMAKKVMRMWIRYVEVHCDAMRLVPKRYLRTDRPEKSDTTGCLWHDFQEASMEAEVILDCLADQLCRKAGIPDWSPDESHDDDTPDQSDHDEALPTNPELECVGA